MDKIFTPRLRGLVALLSFLFTFSIVLPSSIPASHSEQSVDQKRPLQHSALQSGVYTHQAWSGYVDTEFAGGYTAIESTWSIPCIRTPGRSAIWAGIGGYTGSQRLVQAGSEQDGYMVNGVLQTHYYLWVENIANPNNNSQIQVLPANCNDLVYVLVYSSGRMFVQNTTQHRYTWQTFGPAADPYTAEVIVERPLTYGFLFDLPNFGQVTIRNTVVHANYKTGTLFMFANDQIIMVDSNGYPYDIIFKLNASDFAVYYCHFSWLCP